MPCYRHLTLSDRRRLYRLIDARQSVAAIADALGKHRSTIYREIKRNFFHDDCPGASGYFPVTANDRAQQRRRQYSKLARRPDLRDHVIDRLRIGWSPQQIAGRLGHSGSNIGRLCHETIYRFVYSADGRLLELFRCLAKGRKRRGSKFGRKPRRDVIPAVNWISARPAEINDRQTFGHWECDLMIFGKQTGKANVTTLMERKTRYTVLLENPDRRSAGVIGAVGQIFSALPAAARRSITFDRGTEFMAFQALKKTHGVASYFCDPHSPWQKGAVENINGRLRRYLPTETPIEKLNDNALALVTRQFNDTPRRCLGYRTPKEAFDASLASLPLAG